MIKKYMPLFILSATVLATLLSILASTFSYSHAYITISRAKLCQEQQNINCGPIIYEPQSLEGADGFPILGPADGSIASAGIGGRWSLLNEQTPTRWKKTPFTAGANIFQWHFTAVHRSKDFKYYITRQDWDSSQPLSRSSFDLTPFCQVENHNEHPNVDEIHHCTVPARTGYQVILGVWDVADTAASFYQVIDVDFSGSTTPPEFDSYKDVGDIIPTSALAIGSVVKLRVFTETGELINQSLSMTIESGVQGEEKFWPKNFADIINTQGVLKAGVKDSNGKITASLGRNDVFSKKDSSIIRTEVKIDLLQVPEANMNVDVSETQFNAGEDITLIVKVVIDEEADIETQLFLNGTAIAYQKKVNVFNQVTFSLNIENVEAGTYQLITTGKVISSSKLLQNTVSIKVNSSTPPDDTVVYPLNKGRYITGTMLNGENGALYLCKVAPWCNGSADYYAPGYGLAWTSAWDKIAEGMTPNNPMVDFIYPIGKGTYESSNKVQGSDGNKYRCKIANWCNGSEVHYAPGVGLAWEMAWSIL